jgi:hypothetical protein
VFRDIGGDPMVSKGLSLVKMSRDPVTFARDPCQLGK